MRKERREPQNLNLVTSTHGIFIDPINGEQLDMLPDQWARIRARAKDKTFRFENLHMHIHVNSLKEAYRALDGSKALGVDQVSKEDYGLNLDSNLRNLEIRIKRGSYKPQSKREVLIPKADGETKRSIAIACFEDKLVDWVIGKILKEVYEPLFIRNSFGYRPRKSQHDAIKACFQSLERNKRQKWSRNRLFKLL